MVQYRDSKPLNLGSAKTDVRFRGGTTELLRPHSDVALRARINCARTPPLSLFLNPLETTRNYDLRTLWPVFGCPIQAKRNAIQKLSTLLLLCCLKPCANSQLAVCLQKKPKETRKERIRRFCF